MRDRAQPACAGAVLAVLLIFCRLITVEASFRVETAAGLLVSPLTSRIRFDVALANFGVPKYGALLSGQLVYPSTNGAYGLRAECHPIGCNYGCAPFNESTPPVLLKKEPGKRYIMLLDRGPKEADATSPCFFLKKAWHAQLAGADALLVVNDHPGDLSTAVAPQDEDASRELSDLTISAGLISQADGERLKTALKSSAVTVALNWTDLLPKTDKVGCEFWTNSNDECGLVCDQQRKFIKTFKAAAKMLQIKGLVDFQPHYLIWVCDGTSSQEVCDSQCIRGGAYCSPDPDDNIHEGYSGADVLKMNIRSLCFARVAHDRGEPYLWWDFVDRLGEDCPMKEGRFTEECANKVFDATAGPNVGSADGRSAWQKCSDVGPADAKGPLPLLDDELKSQTGKSSGDGAVAILPTVRINGRQYRGNLEAGAVLRGLCAAFPTGSEPPVCIETWVSEDECAQGGDGWRACNSGANSTSGRTRCINTFQGFTCECGAGYMRVTDKATGEQTCAEVNECLASNIPYTREDCKCPRCVCTNTPGGFSCSGPIPDQCTAEHNYGDCWKGTFGGKLYHACADNMKVYRYLSEYGRRNASVKPWRCECPACFKPTPGGGCAPACDLAACDAAGGVCPAGSAGAAAPAGGGGGGVSTAGFILGILAASGLTAAAMYVAYGAYLRKHIAADMHRILDEYIPLTATPLSDPNGSFDPAEGGSTPGSDRAGLNRTRSDPGQV